MKLVNLIFIIAFLMSFERSAHTQSVQDISELQTSTDCVFFSIEKDGLILSAKFENHYKTIDDITITLFLTNKTKHNLPFEEMAGALNGMRFNLIDSSGNALLLTKLGQGYMGHYSLAHRYQQLEADHTLVVNNIPLKNYILLTNFGTYTLKASWGEDRHSDDPFGMHRPPTLELSGSILVQKTNDEISISKAN